MTKELIKDINIEEVKDLSPFIEKGDNIMILGSVGLGKSTYLKKIISHLNCDEVLYVDYLRNRSIKKYAKDDDSFFELRDLKEINEDITSEFYDTIFINNIKYIFIDEFSFFNDKFNDFFTHLLINMRKQDCHFIINIQAPYNADINDFFDINNVYTQRIRGLLPYFNKAFLLRHPDF